jgi:hypothetical protein
MRRLALLLVLLPAVASAQLYTPPYSDYVSSRKDFPINFSTDWKALGFAASSPGCYTTGQPVSASGNLTVSRADAQWVDKVNANQATPGLITEDANTVSHVVWMGGNYALQSGTMTTGTSPTSPWANYGGTVATGPETSLQGSPWSKITASSGAGDIELPSGGVPFNTRFVGSMQVRAATGTQALSVSLRCGAAPTTCSCVRSDGGACTPTIGAPSSADCSAYATVGTTETRLSAIATCPAPISNPVLILYPAQASTGTAWGTQAQLEVGTYPTPYFPVTTKAEGLIDTKGNVWTQNGTVPQNPSTWNAPPSAGVFSDANYYSLGSGVDVLDFAGGHTCTLVMSASSLSNTPSPLSNGVYNTNGYYVQISPAGVINYNVATPSMVSVSSSGVTTGSANVYSFGRSGGTIYSKLNSGATVSASSSDTVPGTSATAKLGRYDLTTFPFVGGIHELYCTTTPWNEATVAALQASVMAKINQPILASCAANTLAVSPQGAEVWAARTNYALQSSTSCVANAVQTPWALSGTPTCVSDAALAPDGTVSMDSWTSATNTHGITQPVTTASSATATSSIWASKPNGTGTVTGTYVCTAGTANSCTCSTSDGSACSTAVATTTCTAKFTAVGTTPVRLALMPVCAAALTNPTIGWYPGEISVNIGTANFWGAQVEVGTYPGPYIPTTAASVARAFTAASIPLPDLHTTDTFCVGLTATPGAYWNDPATRFMFSNYTGSAVNVINLSVAGATMSFQTYDNAGGNKGVTWTHGLGATKTPQRLVACDAAGTIALYANGVSVGAAGGAGTSLFTATPTPLQIGEQNNAQLWDGSITNVKVYPNQTFRAGM